MSRRLLVVGVVLAVLLVPGSASAARLNLTGAPSFHGISVSRCDDAVSVAPVRVSGKATSVVVSGIVAACQGLGVQVRVWDPAVKAVAFTSEVVPATGSGSLTLTGAEFTPTTTQRAYVTVDSWPVPAAWAAGPLPLGTCAPVDPKVTSTCEIVFTGGGSDAFTWWENGYRFNFEIHTQAKTAFEWQATVDRSATGIPVPGGGTAFPGWPVPVKRASTFWTPARFTESNVCFVSGSAELPVLRFRSPKSWNSTVSVDDPATSMGIQTVLGNGNSTVEELAC
jgi:hypothetical protein